MKRKKSISINANLVSMLSTDSAVHVPAKEFQSNALNIQQWQKHVRPNDRQ